MQEDKMSKLLNLIILIMAGFIFYASFFPSEKSSELAPSEVTQEEAVVMPVDPEQSSYWGDEIIPYVHKNLSLKITPKAHYRIYAMVMSKKKYSYGWESNLAPYDLALAWNKLMLPENQKGISYRQSGRWYYFRYDGGYPLSKQYIHRHSANTHSIPANQNVRKGLDRIKKKDNVYLEGYLVYINGTLGKGRVWWKSSLTRNDTGDGACEVFYIKKIILNNEVYE